METLRDRALHRLKRSKLLALITAIVVPAWVLLLVLSFLGHPAGKYSHVAFLVAFPWMLWLGRSEKESN